MTLPATESFTDSDGVQLTTHNSDWTLMSGDFDIISNQLIADSVDTDCLAYWNADSFNNDQYAKADFSNNGGGYVSIGVATRVGASGVNGYLFYYDKDENTSYVAKLVSGSWTQLGSGDAWSQGSTYELDAQNTTLTPYEDDVVFSSIGAQTDSSHSSGSAGVYGYGDDNWLRIDNWEGGNLAAGGVEILRRRREMVEVF